MLLSIEVLHPERTKHQCRTLNLRCDVCGVDFTQPYNKSVSERVRHYCSKACSVTGRTKNPDVPRVRECVCQKCGKGFRRMCNTNAPDPRCCSKSCASSLLAIENDAARHMNTPEAKARAEKSLKAWRGRGTKKPRYVPRHPGRPKSGWKHTPETCARMRESRARLIMAGRMNWALFGHKAGTHESPKAGRGVHYRSTWEQAVMVHLDARADVVAWDAECLRIPYVYENNRRWYIPDFLVTFTDGRRELWEVKAEQFITSEKVVLKSLAAMEYCGREGISAYVMLTGAELRRRGILEA